MLKKMKEGGRPLSPLLVTAEVQFLTKYAFPFFDNHNW